MTLNIEELFTTSSRGARARMTPDARGLYVATFGADVLAELLIAGCPVAYNEVNDEWVPYTQGDDAASYTITSDGNATGTAGVSQVDVITADGTPASAGNFRLLINGHESEFAFDPTGAEMQTQLRAMLLAEYGVDAVACVSSVDVDLGDVNSVITLTFVPSMGLVDIAIEQDGISAGNDHVLSQTTPGVNGVDAASGTFLLIVEGLAAQIAFDATAAQIQSELRTLLGEPSVTAVATNGANLGTDAAIVTLTFDVNYASGAPTVEMDESDMGGLVHVLAAVDVGTELEGANKIRGLVFEDSIQIHASDEVLGVIMVKGEAERDDANTAAVRLLLRGSPSEAELDIALGAPGLKDAGIMVRGLSTVH